MSQKYPQNITRCRTSDVPIMFQNIPQCPKNLPFSMKFFVWFFCISELFCCERWTFALSGWSVVVSTMDSLSGGMKSGHEETMLILVMLLVCLLIVRNIWKKKHKSEMKILNVSAHLTLGEILTTTTSYLQLWRSQVRTERKLANPFNKDSNRLISSGTPIIQTFVSKPSPCASASPLKPFFKKMTKND